MTLSRLSTTTPSCPLGFFCPEREETLSGLADRTQLLHGSNPPAPRHPPTPLGGRGDRAMVRTAWWRGTEPGVPRHAEPGGRDSLFSTRVTAGQTPFRRLSRPPP